MKRTILAAIVFTLLVAGCAFNSAQRPPLIPREIVFGNPAKTDPQISPDGRHLSYLAPDAKNVLQLWVRSLTGSDARPITDEIKRGIRHYTWLCLNPKEADNRSLARAVIEKIPKYLDRPNVLGIGEIGLNRVTRNEVATFQDHLDLAVTHNQMILIHTPHLEDKYKGTRIIVETLLKDGRIDPGRILIDHAEEHTIELILGHGFWAGITLYPQTKVSPQRAIDMIERAGPERICVSSACDWGPSLPIAIPRFALEMRRRSHSERSIRKIIYENPAAFLSQSPRFMLEDATDRNGQKAAPSAPSGAR